jgi:HSP20 family protein
MESFLNDGESPGHGELSAYSPNLDIAEDSKAYHIDVELPGIDEADIDLSFDGGVLRIKGEKKTQTEESEKNFTRVERTYGSFYRAIPFNVDIDDSKIEARFEKGVLKVLLPKAASAVKEAKKIQIKSN